MTGRYVEVNMDETNEIMRMSCPVCKYPMRVLGKHEDNIYHCYCAACQTDRYMKDTFDTEKLTFEEFDRGMKRGKGIDLERISDLVYELYDENEQLKKENNALKNIIQDFIIKEFKITKEDIINGKGGDATDFSSVIDEFFNNEVNISEIQVELKGEKNND